MQFDVSVETWPNRTPFRIAGRVLDGIDVVVARVSQGGVFGEGEAAGVYYHGENVDSMARQLLSVSHSVAEGISRTDLQTLLPAGGARNALDCALWALKAKQARVPAWRLAGFEGARPLVTTYTLSVEPPKDMAQQAAVFASQGATALKMKMNGDGDDLARVAAVREVCTAVWIGVDANRSWGFETLETYAPKLAALRVSLIEQPLEIGDDEQLRGYVSPVPLAADESFQTASDLAALAGLYQVANIKLDKTGGLTEALECVRVGRELGFELMVGNMAGTSLAMAPAFVVGQACAIVDLDGPLYFTVDRAPVTRYEDGRLLEPLGWDRDG